MWSPPGPGAVLMLAAGQGTGASSSSLEACLTALLHTCQALARPQLAALLEPHVSAIWSTFFAAFEAFSHNCEQLSIACCASQPQLQAQVQPQPAAEAQSLEGCTDDQYSGHTVQQAAEELRYEGLTQISEADQSSSRKLLGLLSRCEHMEQLLARLMPAFLAVLNCQDSPQVSCALCIAYLLGHDRVSTTVGRTGSSKGHGNSFATCAWWQSSQKVRCGLGGNWSCVRRTGKRRLCGAKAT